ncbi:unnamed protein product [Adineta steineri]|uniref:Hexosyltransferase n=1 Tax=Adineta steineri TaxID=433720 RepID=A0A818H9R4_9BILA|nr:unnamed protein product [Adineta steineri]CAF3504567.1 unnamed protein product [Adineta steineri]
MFQGYYGRRRLKSILIGFLGFLILIVLLRRRNEPEIVLPPTLPPSIESKTPAPPLVSFQKSGVLSTIGFTNSPYLDLKSYPSDFIPVMVLSKATNIEVRDAIRRTWGFYRSYRGNDLRVKIFFIIGTHDFMTQRILMEQNVFDDIIQVTVPDMYSFGAHKELAAMMWVRSYLPKHKFYIKTEDDVIINMKTLADELFPIIESAYNEDLIIGWFGHEHVIQRGTYQKFIDAVVPPSSADLNYAMSLLYVITASAADRMIETLNQVELIEYPGDPFVTGILRDAAHVQIKNLATTAQNFTYEIANGKCSVAFTKDPDLLVCTSSLHIGSLKSMPEYFTAWNILIGEVQA